MAIEHLMVAAPLVATEAERESDSLPPYLTVFPWFEMPSGNWPHFSEAIRRVVQDAMQPTIQWGDPALFSTSEGSNPNRQRDRAARTFNVVNGLGVHTDIHHAVRANSGNFDPTYVGEHWYPRVSNGEAGKLAEGQELILSELAVFERKTAMGAETIRAVYKWETVSV